MRFVVEIVKKAETKEAIHMKESPAQEKADVTSWR